MRTTVEDTTGDGRWRIQTLIAGGRMVSTVKLAGGAESPVLAALDVMLDAAFGFEKGPYESIVFATASEASDPLHLERYQTEAEARAGHARLVATWRDDA
jgi:hypothetical protein